MADTKVTGLGAITPVLTDVMYIVDDPGGTPASAKVTLQAIMDLLEANFLARASFIDAISEIDASVKSGADATLVTGTAGTSGDLAIWNVDGDLVDGPTPPSGTIVGTTDTQTLTNKTLTSPIISHNITTDADNYTLVAGDANGIIIMSGGSANQLTIPTNAAVAFALGTKVEIWSTGAGTTTIAGDTGVTLQGNGGSASAGSCDIQTQYGGATLTKIGTNTWMVGGDIDVVA